jgi:hypothetical protein
MKKLILLTTIGLLSFLSLSSSLAEEAVYVWDGTNFQKLVNGVRIPVEPRVTLPDALVAPAPAATVDSGTNSPIISGPVTKLFEFLGQGSNWIVATYGIMSSDMEKFGGGVALAYKVTDFIAPVLRLDYYDETVWMPSGSLQLQAPFVISGKVRITPFIFGGVATPLSGKGGENGEVEGIFGVGLSASLSDRISLVADIEKWTNFESEQIRFGFLYKF